MFLSHLGFFLFLTCPKCDQVPHVDVFVHARLYAGITEAVVWFYSRIKLKDSFRDRAELQIHRYHPGNKQHVNNNSFTKPTPSSRSCRASCSAIFEGPTATIEYQHTSWETFCAWTPPFLWDSSDIIENTVIDLLPFNLCPHCSVLIIFKTI